MEKMLVSMDIGDDGVAVIKIDNPPVSSLTMEIIYKVKEKHDEAVRRNEVKAIVLVGGNGIFSSGFDYDFVLECQNRGDISWVPDFSTEVFLRTIEEAKKPTVAAIQRLVIAAGFEMALACHARIATPDAELGFPEIRLGIVPGGQRLPRVVGVSKALDMILSSKIMTSKMGKDLGIFDAVVSSEELLGVSRLWALEIAEKRKPWICSIYRTDKLTSTSEDLEMIKIARQRVSKSAPNMPQHQDILDCIEHGIIHGGYVAAFEEERAFKEILIVSTTKGLFHYNLAQRATLKVPNVTDVGLKPRCMKKVAVIGVGLMGSGIATCLILRNISVLLKEKDFESLQRGLKMIAANLQGLATQGKLTQDKVDKALSLLKGVSDYSEFKYVDMVIEAVDENVPLKQSIFSEIEKICLPQCILATNTSTIDLSVVGEKTSSQDRIIGAHFFSPAHVMPLLEVVRTEKTSPQVILDLMTLGRNLKKVPVVVGNCTGFVINRTFFPYHQAPHFLLNLGVDLYRIDKAISSFGMPMGPFQLSDLLGHQVSSNIMKEFVLAFPERTFDSPLHNLLMKNGKKGKINGKGFYIYDKGSKPKPDPASLEAIIEEFRRLTNIVPGGKPISVSDQDIVEMIFFPIVNEACRVLDEGVAARASDVDLASVLGMSFPDYRGGIVFWADSVGPGYIYTRLCEWAKAYGGFFIPSRFLEERAMKGMPLSAPASNIQGSTARL